MELPPPASLVPVVLATVLFLATILRRRWNPKRKYNLPPGPRPWPVIGNLNLIGALPHRSVHELSKRYGPLMSLRFGSVPVLIGSSVDAARFILKTHDLAFSDRPRTASGRHTGYNYSDVLWAPYGPYWRQARRLWKAEIMSARQLRSHEHVRDEEVRAMLRDIYGHGGGRAVALLDCLLMANLKAISRMVLGSKKYVVHGGGGTGSTAAATTPEEFKWMIDEFIYLSGALSMGDMIPWLRWLDPQIRRIKRLGKMFDRFLEQVLDEHNERRRREGEEFAAMDMVDLLLELADDPSLEVPIGRDGVKGFTLRRPPAHCCQCARSPEPRAPARCFQRARSSEPCARPLAAAARLLAPNASARRLPPQSMSWSTASGVWCGEVVRGQRSKASGVWMCVAQLAACHYRIPGDLIVGGTDTSSVTIEWAMSELLRNPAALTKATEELDRVIGCERLVTEGDLQSLPYLEAIVKETMRLHPVSPLLDVSMDGYDVPTGTLVFVNVWAIGRDPAVWGHAAEEFRPERFVGSSLDVKGQDFELLPFGSGRRICPGIGLGLKMKLSMEEKFGLSVQRMVSLEAVAEPRLPAHVYGGP
ncbi:hypothetical protein HU200_023373 [Digitaria exilis]|uniref:Cytochrome P450 n=1 Tax=Digitaria exilis TaxID=1010633 RepID=A0A835CCR7_9POAL|nr:hypothetical protein HU200_023373 [Digitaria exilis]